MVHFKLTDIENTIPIESNLLLDSPMIESEGGSDSDSSSDGQNEEVISSRTNDKKYIHNMFLGEKSTVQ